MAAPAEGTRPTRERILDAALAAFADRGVEATSLDSLAVEIGVRKQTILYWFPSKEVLLLAVVDHAVADLSERLQEAASAPIRRRIAAERVESAGQGRSAVAAAGPASVSTGAAGPSLQERLVAVVDATFRLGTTHPELLAVVREVTRTGPPASTHLAAAVEPLVATAAAALAAHSSTDPDRIRRVLLGAGARVIGMATEAEVRADLGLVADRAWLRARRRSLIESLAAELS